LYSRNRIGFCFIFRGNLERTSTLGLLYQRLILQHNGTVMWDDHEGRLYSLHWCTYCHCVPNVLLVTYCVADCTRRISSQ